MRETAEARTERVRPAHGPAMKRTLQMAAAVAGKTVSEFLLDSSLTAAYETLADRRVFHLTTRSGMPLRTPCRRHRRQSRFAQTLAHKPSWIDGPATAGAGSRDRSFASGVSELDTWLKKRARLNERTGRLAPSSSAMVASLSGTTAWRRRRSCTPWRQEMSAAICRSRYRRF